MASKGIMALDQGTTSSRAVIFGPDGAILASAQETFSQHYPEPGWVEHDPEDIWATQLRCCRLALERSGLRAADLAAIGIANQRETVLLWDADSGSPLGNAIVWQCRRTAGRCAELEAAGWGDRVRALTGLRLDPYFSATKLEWLLANRLGARDLLRRGRLRAGTIDSFLVWRLTGGRSHVTDFSNASRTMLLDLERLEWSGELLDLFGLPASVLPELRPSSGIVGATDPSIFGVALPIAGIAGDQQAALFGHGGLEAGDSKNTYGTGCFLLVNTGDRPAAPENGLLSTVAWVLDAPGLPAEPVMGATALATGGKTGATTDAAPDSRAARHVRYALEGSVFTAGAAVQWLRDGLGLLDEAVEVGPLAARVPDSGDVYFVPALTGLGAPYWDPYARGMLIGLTRGTTREHVARAAEEAICFQTVAVLEALSRTAAVEIESLRVDGGGAGDDFLLQLQADLADVQVVRPRISEITALGAAALAGVAVGYWSEVEVAGLAGVDRLFEPRMSPDERLTRRARWEQAVERARGWAT
jgi:glycerol kinase